MGPSQDRVFGRGSNLNQVSRLCFLVASSTVFAVTGQSCKSIEKYSRFAREEEWLFTGNSFFVVTQDLSEEIKEILLLNAQIMELHEVDQNAARKHLLKMLLAEVTSSVAWSPSIVFF